MHANNLIYLKLTNESRVQIAETDTLQNLFKIHYLCLNKIKKKLLYYQIIIKYRKKK